MKCMDCEQDFDPVEMKFTDVIGKNRVEIRCEPCFRGEKPEPVKSKKGKKVKKDEPIIEVQVNSIDTE